MPRREDIKKILLIGSGPIVIGQACEFDYSGTQACKALKQEGYEVILVNSNPATIMTDPQLSDKTYIEPLTIESLERIIKKERPDALLPTMGGQTALNLAVNLSNEGILEKFGVNLIGANETAIKKAEDRKLFKAAMEKIGAEVPKSDYAYNVKEAILILERIGLPCIIRPSFTLGGSGGAIAYNKIEFKNMISEALSLSMIGEVLIEESIIGWKEYELEVMRDVKDNVVIICSIENFDPMGIHTGDSITVAPAQTLTDVEYQKLRNLSLKIIREIGVETGGSNIQFAIHPDTGRIIVIEMNPRVSRSSALASKATGFPIAKFAAKLAVGYSLDEILNDITKNTPASFEPVLDYCVVKIPRWAFEKFEGAKDILTVQMKSVGETMAIGRTFKEAMQKAIRSLEISAYGLNFPPPSISEIINSLNTKNLLQSLSIPTSNRIFYLYEAIKRGVDVSQISAQTGIGKWFIYNLYEIFCVEDALLNKKKKLTDLSKQDLLTLKQFGFSDIQIGTAFKSTPQSVRSFRKKKGVTPVFKCVDTCAAEFEAFTPYYYSTYEQETEYNRTKTPKVIIIGGGPNRIGQGIEFDYCCVHSALALKELNYETVMVNSNPETVSTDYDISDILFFEPLTEEDILNICDDVKPEGIIIQLGGQTPLNLAKGLENNGVKILGTSYNSIDRAEDRERFNKMIRKLKLNQPPAATAMTLKEARAGAKKIGYPIISRPSYVLGGRAMEIIYDETNLDRFYQYASEVSPGNPLLIDKFLEDAIEIDVDAISDGNNTLIIGIMEHIEEAGVHSGDAMMTLPPYTLSDNQISRLKTITRKLAKELKVIGLMNIQFALKSDVIYILEVNPRGSRTVPFISKATGIPMAKIASKLMVGKKLKDLLPPEDPEPAYFAVKASVFPFRKFKGIDIILGPEMRSTGEVMGIDNNLGIAYSKAEISSFNKVPSSGNVFISVKDADKRNIVLISHKLKDLGFNIFATSGTAKILTQNGIDDIQILKKIDEGRPNPLDMIINGNLDLIINTPSGKGPRTDEAKIRSMALTMEIPIITTIPGSMAAVMGIEARKKQKLSATPLQEYYLKQHTSNKNKGQ